MSPRRTSFSEVGRGPASSPRQSPRCTFEELGQGSNGPRSPRASPRATAFVDLQHTSMDVAKLRRQLFEEVEEMVAQTKAEAAARAPQRPKRPESLNSLSPSASSPALRGADDALSFSLGSSQGTTGACTPTRDEASQRRRMRYSSSVDKLGAGSEAFLTPSPRLRDFARFHLPNSPRTLGPMKTEPGSHTASYHAKEQVRFHRESYARSLTPDAQERWRGLAGSPSETRRRTDTPGGLLDSLGKVRAQTPDYHQRYGSSLAGLVPGSLSSPPASPDAALSGSPRLSPRCESRDVKAAVRFHAAPDSPSKSFRRVLQDGFQPTETRRRDAKVACRFHASPESPANTFRRRAQSINLSSTAVRVA